MSKKHKYFEYQVIFFPDVIICQHLLHVTLTFSVRLHTLVQFFLCFFIFYFECLFDTNAFILTFTEIFCLRRKIKNIENQ